MSSFKDFLGTPGQPTESDPGMAVEGSFSCSICYEHVDDAMYFPAAKMLVWKCSSKHPNYIEGFDL